MIKYLASIISAYVISGLIFLEVLKINSQIPYEYSHIFGWFVILIWPLMTVVIYRLLVNGITRKKPKLTIYFSIFTYISSFALFIASTFLIFIIEVYYFNVRDFHLNEPFYFNIFQAINIFIISTYYYFVDYKRNYLTKTKASN